PPVPTPLSTIACGELAALPEIVNVPVRVPLAVGVNVTLKVQMAFGASDDPHELLCEKSPDVEIPPIDRFAVPMFWNWAVDVWLDEPTCWLANVRDGCTTEIKGACATPAPVSDTTCGLPGAASLTTSVPVRVPTALGVNLMLTMQLPVPAIDAPQLFVCVK